MLKKIIAALIAVTLSAGIMTSCSKKDGNSDKPQEMRDISSVELVKEMRVGWNLGNTLDATVNGEDNSPDTTETGWGNPKTTKAMIDKVIDSGFNIIRIPVTWEGHMSEGPDFTIDKEWMDRVQEVVDYAHERDVFVILNIHHEEWHTPKDENYEAAKAQLIKVWEQIAKRFENYDERLIFEGMNEPRLKNTPMEWTGGNKESREVINKLNADFVSTIRSSGGNNPKRHLMIPTYAAASSSTVINDFVVPEDDKVIVSIHAYLPYLFSLADGYEMTEFDPNNASDTREIDEMIKTLNTNFIEKNRAVIIGEFGAREKSNLEARTAWAEYYVKEAKKIGVPCTWWDNGAFFGNGELFGLLDREANTWMHQTVVDALMKGAE